MPTVPEVPDLLAPVQPQDLNPSTPTLDDQMQQTQDRGRDDFVSTLHAVAPLNPDQFGKALQISKLSGIEPDVLVKHNKDMELLLKGNRYAGVYDQYRKTADALKDGKTAAVAQDDLDSLTRIENAAQVSRFNEQSPGEMLWGSIASAWKSSDQASQVGYADRLQRLTDSFDKVDQEITQAALTNTLPYGGKPAPLTGFTADYYNLPPEGRVEMRNRLLGRQTEAVKDAAAIQHDLDAAPIEPGAIRSQELGGDASAMASAIAENPGYAIRTAIGSAASSSPMLVAGALGGPLVAGLVEFGSEKDSKLTDVLREAGIDLNNPKAVLSALQDDTLMADARTKAARKAAGTTAVDVLSMGIAGKLLVPKGVAGKTFSPLQREAVNLAVQAPVQGVLGGASEAAGQYLAEGKVNGADVLMEAVAGAAGSSIDVATFGARHIADSIGQGLEQARRARAAKETLDEMVGGTVDGKTRGRDADTFNRVTTNQLKDSPFETISIPAEALSSLNQDGAPPVLDELLAKVPGLAQQYAEAEATGGALTMKTADYLTYFADHHEQLANSIRVQHDGMSLDEVKVWQDAQEQQINDLADSLKAPPDARSDALVSMVGELQGAGYRRGDAEQYAGLHVSAMSVLADRVGKALPDLLNRFQLSVRNKAPESVQRIPVDDVRLAIQRLRAGDIPQSRDLFGKSLVEYLRDAGGLNDEGGELDALDANVGKVGKNRLVKKSGGLSLDDAAMRAWENGYFPGVEREDVTPQLIIDAVQRDMNDQPTFSAENENATLRDQAANLNALNDYLDQLGVNLNELDDDQVLAILRNPEAVDGTQMNQDVIRSEAFQKWFDGSQVVDEDGKPLRVFHGSESDIEIFQSGKESIFDYGGDAESGGFFFTPDADDASYYAGTSKGANLLPAYLSLKNPLRMDAPWDLKTQAAMIRQAREDGYDGVILNGGSEYVAFEPGQIKSAIGNNGDFDRDNPSILNQSGPELQPRGYITFNKPGSKQRTFQITVTGKRDLSTLLHEFGHYYLEVVNDLAGDADAPQQIRDDVQAIRDWTGAKLGAFETEQHEQFARGFEAYLAEGKAPNPELQGAFARFKRWIISVYKDLRRLNVELNPEIRAVMDRIVATDEQIRAAEQVTQAIPLFESAQKAGMTDSEFKAYRDQLDLAHDEAATTIEQQIIREEERRRSKWWAEETGRVTQEVNEEFDTVPEYAAIKALRTGVLPDGTLRTIKLNSSELREQYGKGVASKLAFMHSREGMDSDIAASILGFKSGDDLVKSILGTPPRGQAVKAEVEQRMTERHGARSSGEAADRAMAAVHNEKRGAVLLKELQALGKQGNRQNISSQQVLKAAAQRIMSGRKVRDIQPFEYQRAEGMAGRRAFEAAAKGDLATAYQAKQQQLLNYHLWREAKKARDSVDSIVDRMAKFNKTSTRERLGKAGHDYLDQIDAVMEQYEFRNVSLRDVDKRTSFAKWYADQLAAGHEPVVPEFLLNNAQKTNFKDLSLDQLQELDEFAQNVNHLARLKNKLLASDRGRTFEETVSDLTEGAYANREKRKPLPIDKSTMSAAEKFGQGFGAMSASLLKMEQIVDWLDGGDVNGPWNTAFYQPFVEAQAHENDLNRQLTTQLMKNIDEHQQVSGKKGLKEQFVIPEINQTLTKNAIIAAALNVGNAGNRSKLLKGHGWEEHQLQAILSKMTAADWKFVEAQWKLVESLYPQIEKLERDIHGIPPEKVVATPVQTPFGEVSGGYWPLVYDQTSPAFANVQNAMADGTGLFEEGYGKATTPRGHTKARTDGFAAPIVLDTAIVANHLGQVVHDLTHRRAIMDAAKIIGNKKVKQTLIDTMGNNIANQFNPWLRGVANDRSSDAQQGVHWWSKVMRQGSTNLSIAWMGFSATTGIQQIMGYGQTLERLSQTGGRAYLFKGLAQFYTHPIDTVTWVKSVSGEMRNRDMNLDNNIREAIRKSTGDVGTYAVMQRLAFKHIALIQNLVDYPSWLAGYHQAIDEGQSHDAAVMNGDRTVRLTQMAGGAKDLAAVQRNTIMKPFTVVYSYFNLLYNRQADLVHSMKTAQGVTDYLKAFERTAYLMIIPAVVGPLLVGNGPKDDESYAKWAALKIATYPLMGVPFVRDAASAIESGFGYNGATPIGDAFKSTVRLAMAAKQDEVDAQKITLATMDVVGTAFGIPTAQPKRSVRYLFGVQDGTAPDADIVDWLKGLMFGPPKK